MVSFLRDPAGAKRHSQDGHRRRDAYQRRGWGVERVEERLHGRGDGYQSSQSLDLYGAATVLSQRDMGRGTDGDRVRADIRTEARFRLMCRHSFVMSRSRGHPANVFAAPIRDLQPPLVSNRVRDRLGGPWPPRRIQRRRDRREGETLLPRPSITKHYITPCDQDPRRGPDETLFTVVS